MQRMTAKLLEDIRDAAAFIRQATAAKSLNDYTSDRLMRQAVERNFEILGEACCAFLDMTQRWRQRLKIILRSSAFGTF
jgi:uncharacterized protein with HEPN domain